MNTHPKHCPSCGKVINKTFELEGNAKGKIIFRCPHCQEDITGEILTQVILVLKKTQKITKAITLLFIITVLALSGVIIYKNQQLILTTEQQ